jgi:hypothetical protein
MKRLIVIVFLFLGVNRAYTQKIEISLNAIAGITIIDVESALQTTLEDWSTFSYGGYILGMYKINDHFMFGIDAGYHRLYYWEEPYLAAGYGTYYRWGDAATIHAGPVIELQKHGFFLQAGGNVRIFTDGSGVVPGIMGSAGYNIKLTDKLALPVGLRADIVFGSGVPIAVDFTIGLKYAI